MTTQQSFKRRVRARMEKTGESYTAARAQLLPEPEWEAAHLRREGARAHRAHAGTSGSRCSTRGAPPSASTPRSPPG